ncbi:hypothetical protein [Brevundimonas sp.]|uniref:hypothetical protein n=1 Tax=Brevundimonas sp. TaxID=1871086 RepID=UPI003AFFC2A2
MAREIAATGREHHFLNRLAGARHRLWTKRVEPLDEVGDVGREGVADAVSGGLVSAHGEKPS